MSTLIRHKALPFIGNLVANSGDGSKPSDSERFNSHCQTSARVQSRGSAKYKEHNSISGRARDKYIAEYVWTHRKASHRCHIYGRWGSIGFEPNGVQSLSGTRWHYSSPMVEHGRSIYSFHVPFAYSWCFFCGCFWVDLQWKKIFKLVNLEFIVIEEG